MTALVDESLETNPLYVPIPSNGGVNVARYLFQVIDDHSEAPNPYCCSAGCDPVDSMHWTPGVHEVPRV